MNLDYNALFSCCGSETWAKQMQAAQPFANERELIAHAEDIWYNQCTESDWRAAFSQHPKIGDLKSLEAKFANTKHLAGNEQAGVNTATSEIISALAQANTDYENKNGFIFIVCATGKSAAEMLRLLQDRLHNSPQEELHIAMGEQHKITIIRLKKLLPDADWSALKNSQITTHILDTSLGKPGQNICIRLKKGSKDGTFHTICQGVTNADGRIGDLLPPSRILPAGIYQMSFDTAAYFRQQDTRGFYPAVDIQFEVWDNTHYHVPLLINPFGYSTYRGS